MNRNNRYCCLVMPTNILEECNYFEIELQVKNLKTIIKDINNELKTNFDHSTAIIDDKYGILLYENNSILNEYIYKLSGINKFGKCLLISHYANFDEFIKKAPKYTKTNNLISHNSTLCSNMIMLCIEYITAKHDYC